MLNVERILFEIKTCSKVLSSSSQNDDSYVMILFKSFNIAKDGLKILEELGRHSIQGRWAIKFDVEDMVLFQLANKSR